MPIHRVGASLEHVRGQGVDGIEFEQAGGCQFCAERRIDRLHQIDTGDRVDPVVREGIVPMDAVAAHAQCQTQVLGDRVANEVGDALLAGCRVMHITGALHCGQFWHNRVLRRRCDPRLEWLPRPSVTLGHDHLLTETMCALSRKVHTTETAASQGATPAFRIKRRTACYAQRCILEQPPTLEQCEREQGQPATILVDLVQ